MILMIYLEADSGIPSSSRHRLTSDMPTATVFCEVDVPWLGCKEGEVTFPLDVLTMAELSSCALAWGTKSELANLERSTNGLLVDAESFEVLE